MIVENMSQNRRLHRPYLELFTAAPRNNWCNIVTKQYGIVNKSVFLYCVHESILDASLVRVLRVPGSHADALYELY